MPETHQNYYLRDILGGYMVELGKINDRIIVVNADLMGTCRNRSFVEAFPKRSINVGIAEQNMVSFAAGLAHEGFIPYAFSMAPFISMRACEQCRTDVAYNNMNVRLISTYSGVSGGISGATHWAIEDCAIMCAVPGMTVMEPCDPLQAKKMLECSAEHSGPIYIRSSVEPVINVYDSDYCFEIGKASLAKDGNDGAFICSGITVKYALSAAEIVKKNTGKEIRVIDMHTLKPLDRQAIIDAAKTGKIVTAHDHNVSGGLGQLVAEVIASEKLKTDFVNLGIEDKFVPMAHAPYLYHKFSLDDEGLARTMIELINKED